MSAVALARPARTFADVCPAIRGGNDALAARDAAERLRFIVDHLHTGAERALIWTNAWTAGQLLLTGAPLLGAPLFSSSVQIDLYVGAATSAIGVLSINVLPLSVIEDAPALEARLAGPSRALARCTRLQDAEQVFLRDADSEGFGVSWVSHLANVALNLAAGAVLGFGYGHWESAIYGTGIGIAVGEALIFTQPTDLLRALAHYRRGELETRPAPRARRWNIGPAFVRDGWMVTLGVEL